MVGNMRKGQTLCNYIQKKFNCDNEEVHRFLFYMSDKEFEEAFSEEWWNTVDW